MGNDTQETTEFVGDAEPQVFGAIQKDDNTLIMISLNKYKSYEYLDFRQWWKPKGEEDYKPTKSGFTLPVKDTLDYLTQFIEALEKARTSLEESDDGESKNA